MEEPLLSGEDLPQETEEAHETPTNYDIDMGSERPRADSGEDVSSNDLTRTTMHIPARQALILRSIFLLLGVGILVPWNAFISAKPYFASRFCENEGDLVNPHLESKFSLAYNLSAITWLGGILLWQYIGDQRAAAREPDITLSQRVETSSSHHESGSHAFWLVIVPLGLYVAVFVGQSFGVAMVHAISPSTFETLTLMSMGLCGMCGATATAGILATAGLFPSTVGVGPFLAGQSVGGVAVSLANFIAALWEDPKDYWNANCQADTDNTTATIATDSSADVCIPYNRFDVAVFGYFLVGSFVLTASLFGYIYIDYYQRTTVSYSMRSEYETVDEAHDAIINSTNAPIGSADMATTVDQSPRVGLEMMIQGTESRNSDATDGVLHRRPSQPRRAASLDHRAEATQIIEDSDDFLDEPSPSDDHNHVSSHNETQQVFQKVREPALTIYMVFVVTLALFPGWISELHSVNRCQSHSRLDNDLYSPTAFVIFNSCDLLGRVLAGYVPVTEVHHLPRKLVSGAFLRFLCFPLFSLCLGGSSDRVQIPSNFYSLLVQILFGVSNGFLVSLAFIFAPTTLPPTSHVQERSAELLNFSLSFGLLTGSFLSFPVSLFLK